MSDRNYDVPGFSGVMEQRRSDGLRIVTNIDGDGFHVPESPRGNAINDCPCCSRRLRTVRAAQLVMEQIYPFAAPSA